MPPTSPPPLELLAPAGNHDCAKAAVANGILVRNLAGLDFFTGRSVPCVADF